MRESVREGIEERRCECDYSMIKGVTAIASESERKEEIRGKERRGEGIERNRERERAGIAGEERQGLVE